MVTFFPEPYEDELLYSILARYHVRSANISYKETFKELYGRTTIVASVELPCNISELLSNIPEVFNITTDEIIRKHTLYPFYSAFLLDKRKKEVYDLMVSNGGSKIYAAIGETNKPIKSNTYLRYCAHCVQEDINQYGEPYWHRMHQIPSLPICVKHKEVLKNSTIEIHLKNRQEFRCLSIELINKQDRNFGTDNEHIKVIETSHLKEQENIQIVEKLVVLGNNVDYIMNNNINVDGVCFKTLFLTQIEKKGYLIRKNTIDQTELLKVFRYYYGSEILNITGCNYDYTHDNWVSTITRKHRKGFHTIQYLLIFQFLNLTLNEMSYYRNIMSQKVSKNFIRYSEIECMPYREKWLKAIEDNPGKSKSDLREINTSLYTWLFRHDNEWLFSNSPIRKVGVRNKSIIDWESRDEVYLKLVKEQIMQLKNSIDKPERITIGAIGRTIKNPTILQRRIDKMPRTKEYLMKHIETVEEIQVRRIKWAVDTLSEQGIVSRWQVVELAGLSKKYKDQYIELIDKLLM